MVFDANMRYLHAGAKFTARVFAISPESRLAKYGFKLHDSIECEMLTESIHDCKINVVVGDTVVEFKEDYIIDNRTWLILENVHWDK
jgi:hypothetical protein